MDIKKLALMLEKHQDEKTKLTVMTTGADGQPVEVEVSTAFYFEDMDGNGTIRLQ